MTQVSQQISQQPQSTVSGVSIALIVFMWVAWLALVVIFDFFAFMMFAFTDSPGSAKSAQLMIVPIFCWFAITFVAGIFLLIFKGPWQIPLAFILAISPPFVVFAGYNLLAGASNVTITTGPPPPPAVPMNMPPGGFKPNIKPIEQPDFSKYTRAATRPTTDEN